MQVLKALQLKLLTSLVPSSYHAITRLPRTPLTMVWVTPKTKLRLMGNSLTRDGAGF